MGTEGLIVNPATLRGYQPPYDWKRMQRETRREKARRAYRRQTWHPDNDLIKYKLEQVPCPACGQLTVRFDKKSRGWNKHQGQRKHDYYAVCGTCAASGTWPVTGMPVEFIVAAIQRKMKFALVKELMKP